MTKAKIRSRGRREPKRPTPIPILLLLHHKEKAFEVAAFGVEIGDGVIVSLTVALEDTHFSA